jgi:hypothetical protein
VSRRDDFITRGEVENLLRSSLLGMRFGVIAGTSPLRVHLDGDPGPLPVTPMTAVAVRTGDWVTVAMLPNPDPERESKRPLILAVVGGRPGTAPYREWYALAVVTVTNGAGSTVVNFPAGLFTVPPLVQATRQTGAAARYIPYVSPVTKDGCTVGLYDPTQTTQAATPASVAIHAVQATPTQPGGVPQA